MKKLLLSILLASMLGATGIAQTLADEILMSKYELCVATIYDHGTWNKYWEGKSLRENANIGTLTRNMAMPMMAAGITDKLNLIVSAPYIKTKSSGGQLAGVQGFQDLTVGLKYQLLKKELYKGKLTLLGTTSYATPISNYLSDYMPYSLGLGTNEITLRGIGHYQFNNGIYIRQTAAILWRGQSEVERDYYYNNGSYYTRFMDVPNAWTYTGTAGVWLLNYALRVEVSYQTFNCLTGDDIRSYNSPQPTNKVEVDQVNGFAQYFFKKNKLKGFGVLATYSQMLDGRNMGKFTNLGAGITYQFQAINSK